MAYAHSEVQPDSGAHASTKIVIAGGFGAGKTTFVGAVVLVGDLAASGHLDVHGTPSTSDGNPTPAILTRLLEGLRAR